MSILATNYAVSWASGIYTITWASVYPPISFNEEGAIFLEQQGNLMSIGPVNGQTWLDWTKCTAPVAANKTDLLTAIQALSTGAAVFSSIQVTGLTANQAVVTNGSKELASLPYTDSPTASSLASRDSSGNTAFVRAAANTMKLGATRTNDTVTATVDLHLQSTGDLKMWFEADSDNAGTEADDPEIIMTKDGNATMHTMRLGDNSSSNDLEFRGYGSNFRIFTGGTVSASADGVLPTITGAATERFSVSTTAITATLPISGTSMQFTTSGGTAAALNYYEENQTHSSTFSGIWAAAQTPSLFKFSRSGKTITMFIAGVAANSNAAGVINLDTVIPTKWRPAVDFRKPIVVVDDLTFQFGSALINADGTMSVSATAASAGNFTGGGALSGFFGFEATWILT